MRRLSIQLCLKTTPLNKEKLSRLVNMWAFTVYKKVKSEFRMSKVLIFYPPD